MSEGLNRLIAMGGTQVKSPYQRYLMGKQQNQQEASNALALEANRLSIDNTRQQMGIRNQESKVKQTEAYLKNVAPKLREVLSSQDPQATYQKSLPYFQQIAESSGVQFDASKPLDLNASKAILDKYDPLPSADIKTINKLVDGVYMEIQYERNSITGDYDRELGRKPANQRTESLKSGYSTPKTPSATINRNNKEDSATSKSIALTNDIGQLVKNAEPESFNVFGDIAVWFGKAGENLGMTYADDSKMSNLLEDDAQRKTFANKLKATVRKADTGLTANKIEMKEINRYLPADSDNGQALLRKAKAIQSILERDAVRLQAIRSGGYRYVKSKNGGVIYTPNGKKVSAEEIPSLSYLESHNSMRDKLYNKYYSEVKDPIEAKKMSLEEMISLGYNVTPSRYKKFFDGRK